MIPILIFVEDHLLYSEFTIGTTLLVRSDRMDNDHNRRRECTTTRSEVINTYTDFYPHPEREMRSGYIHEREIVAALGGKKRWP
jgi:hypothetical protein